LTGSELRSVGVSTKNKCKRLTKQASAKASQTNLDELQSILIELLNQLTNPCGSMVIVVIIT